jgi:hypothetical protein
MLALLVGLVLGVPPSAMSSRVHRTSVVFDQRRAIRVALARFAHSWMLAPFPRSPARMACAIPGGGLAGGSFAGTCQTRVSKGRRFVTVAFTESWDSSVFNGDNAAANTSLSHTWIVIEALKFVALDSATFGDFPPQWVR